MENKSEKILKILEEKAPTTGKEIAKEASIPYSTCVRLLSNLCDEEKVAKIYSSSGRIYYLLNKQATIRDVSNMHIEIAKDTIEAKDSYEGLSNEIASMRENVNGLYANLISIISVFVAIFALITVNANIAFELTKENMRDVFWGIIVSNLFVIVCIITLLIATKLIIIDPIIKRKKKK